MELKSYQQEVINDLTEFIERVNDTKHLSDAFTQFWTGKGVPSSAYPPYRDTTLGVPNVCVKAPTGAGKTFIGCAAVKPILDGLGASSPKVVVWLVPSDAILQQTLANLQNQQHPYRQRLNRDFSGRVEVINKEDALQAVNFQAAAIGEQLTVLVLSYDSFRRTKTEGLKAYQENSALEPLWDVLKRPKPSIDGADETSLVQILHELHPLLIVDESHHTQSKLSKQMLNNFAPCFVFCMTATPDSSQNIISYVDAVKLKKANMVKLPLIAYNQRTTGEVISTAIDMRRTLEQFAVQEEQHGGAYIRPIVLLQAQPDLSGKDTETYDKIKAKLVAAGIPQEQIAIKVSGKDELKGIDLMSRDCEIRFIITIDALKEGWDCPFAYILATVANRTSRVAVEQVVGRILRQPYARQCKDEYLNSGFIFTSSANFHQTVQDIVTGLNKAGFTGKDFRAVEQAPQMPDVPQPPVQQDMDTIVAPQDDELLSEETIAQIRTAVERTSVEQANADHAAQNTALADILDSAKNVMQTYNEQVQQAEKMPLSNIPDDMKNKMTKSEIRTEFQDNVKDLRLPQFFLLHTPTPFDDGKDFLDRENLNSGFTLTDKDCTIAFDSEANKAYALDADEKVGVQVDTYDKKQLQQLKQYFSQVPTADRQETAKAIIRKRLSAIRGVDDQQLRKYLDRIVENLNREQLNALEDTPQLFADKIKNKIDELLRVHRKKVFAEKLKTEEIVCEPFYRFPVTFYPIKSLTPYKKSLYTIEEAVDSSLEQDMIDLLMSHDNILWWHRNPAKTATKDGFYLNGYINHYPDFIARTVSGKILVIETKGDMLDGTQTQEKLDLGKLWEKYTPNGFQYYLVYQKKTAEGVYSFAEFSDWLERL